MDSSRGSCRGHLGGLLGPSSSSWYVVLAPRARGFKKNSLDGVRAASPEGPGLSWSW